MFDIAAPNEAMSITESHLLANQPFFASLLFNKLQVVATRDPACPTAATDGKTMWINLDFFDKLNNAERVFLYCHEIGHAMFLHMARSKNYADILLGPDGKPFNPKKFNHAADYVINALLTESNIGAMPIGGLINPQITGSDLTDEVYKRIPDPDPEDNDGFDQHINPDSSMTEADAADMEVAIKQAAAAAKSMGKLPGGLADLIDVLLNPKTDWRQYLMQEFCTAAANSEANWQKANRRRLLMGNPTVILPTRAGTSCGVVAAIIDTSGSISQHEAGAFLSEVANICSNFNPEEIYLLWTDTAVRHVDHLEDTQEIDDIIERCRTKRLPGGGGTNMPAAFQYLSDWGIVPSTCIVFTDGYTPFGDAQPYRVVWGITDEAIAAKGVPHGGVVHISIDPE
jgi:predicted metal-dependent peptidase